MRLRTVSRRMLSLAACVALCAALAAVPVQAQSTADRPAGQKQSSNRDSLRDDVSSRAAVLLAARREKETDLHPPEEQRWERRADWVQHKLRRSESPGLSLWGFSPALGGLKSGAGFINGGIRWDPTRENPGRLLSVEALVSTKLYWGVEATAGLKSGAAFGYGFGRYWHLPKEDYFGIGSASSRDLRTDFRRNEWLFGALAGLAPGDGVLVGAHAAYEMNRLGPGKNDGVPPITEYFDAEEVPGYGEDLDFLILGGFLELDRRDIPAKVGFARRFAPTHQFLHGISMDARKGFYWSAQISHYMNRNGRAYDFTRAELEAQQFIPFRRGYHVFAFRELASLTNVGADQQVPFYLMQTLGGSRTLRGFRNDRLRDINVLLVNAEYRYQVWLYTDVALFVDAGQVFRATDEIDVGEMAVSYGLGVRMKSPRGLIARLDVGRSPEGIRPYLTIGASL